MSTNSYAYTAKDRAGCVVTDRVEAPLARDAIDTLARSGFSDIRLHDDGSRDALTSPTPAAKKAQLAISPAMARKLEVASEGRELWLMILLFYRKFMVIVVVLAAVLWNRRLQGAAWSMLDSLNLAALFAPALLCVLFGRFSRVYRRLQVACVDGRWDDAERLLPRVEPGLRKIGPGGLLELTRLRGRMLIERGRSAEAMRLLDSVRNTPGISDQAFLSAKAGLLQSLPDFPAALEARLAAAADAADVPILWIGVAEIYAVHLR
jgi:hypothetical protein